MKESTTKREDVLKPTNPAAQKAVMANQHKVSPRPVAKIRPKALHGRRSGDKVSYHYFLLFHDICYKLYSFTTKFVNGPIWKQL